MIFSSKPLYQRVWVTLTFILFNQPTKSLLYYLIARITELREKKNWTEYQLAERSGLTQSTISSWYRKDILPTIPSLERICIAFGISISQFFDDNSSEITLINPKQKQLLEHASKLDNEQYDALINFLDKL